MNYAFIGCRLPNGIIACVRSTKIRLNGANAENAAGGFGFTRVPAEFAEAWLGDGGEGARRTATKRGGIFGAGTMEDAVAIAAEMSGERGGFERLDPEKAAPGIVPTDETRKEIDKAAGGKKPGPRAAGGKKPAPDAT